MSSMDKKARMKKLNLEYSRLPKGDKNWSLSEKFVPGEGPLDARIMFIGQAPGRNEDIEKRPFVGISGRFLDKLMIIAGIERERAYVASVVQFFPPENRIPTKEEILLCRRFILEQIEIVDPRIVILLGAVSAKTILNIEGNIMSHRGTAMKKDGRTYLISMHPAAAIRMRKHMPTMEQDFKNFRKIVNSEIN
jgi:DNA polymerase